MYSTGDRVFDTNFDAFVFEKRSVFDMFLQMYASVLRQEQISARLEKKFDMLMSAYNSTGYGVANAVEIMDDTLIESSNLKSRDLEPEARYNTTRAFGVLASNDSFPVERVDNLRADDVVGPSKDTLLSESKIVEGAEILTPASPEDFGVQMDQGPFSTTTRTDDITDENDPLFYYSPHNRSFRISGKQLYLTYPQSGSLTREDIVHKVESEFGEVAQYVACYELHKDGNKHIHAYIKMVSKVFRKGSPRWLDIDGHHPNIENRIRSLTAVIRYVTKGGDFISKNIDVDYLLSAEGRGRNGVRMQASVDLLDNGSTPLDIVHKYKTPLFGLTGLLRDVASYKQLRLDADTVHNPLREFSIAGIPFVFEGKHKEKQFWIMGPTNTGKTTIIDSFMEQGYLGYALPTDGWFEGWHNKIGFVYAKEFHGGIKLYILNEFLEGSVNGAGMRLPIKNGHVYKTINVPVLKESNLYPHEVYHNVSRARIDALAARLNIIMLEPHADGRKGYSRSRLLTEEEYTKILDDHWRSTGRPQ